MSQLKEIHEDIFGIDDIYDLDIKLTHEMFWRCLRDESESVQIAAVSRPDFIPDEEQLDYIFASPSTSLLRMCILKNTSKLAERHIARAIEHRNVFVRASLFFRGDLKLTGWQLNKGARDSEKMVRESCIKRDDFIVTPDVLDFYERELHIESLVLAIKKDEFPLDDARFESYLNHGLYPVRTAVISRKDFVVTEERIEKGLSSSIIEERQTWFQIKRNFEANLLAENAHSIPNVIDITRRIKTI